MFKTILKLSQIFKVHCCFYVNGFVHQKRKCLKKYDKVQPTKQHLEVAAECKRCNYSKTLESTIASFICTNG